MVRDLEPIRAGWCLWTCDPVDQPSWSESNPATGQCASTALVVQDLLGGELLMAEVHEADGSRQGVHYWNRLPGQYHLLSARVARALDGAVPDSRAVTVKAVCREIDGRVLLCRNHRGQWELPGGRPDVGEPFPDCLRRELREETGMDVVVDNVLGARPMEVLPDTWIDVVAYECEMLGEAPTGELRPSAEHTSVAFMEASSLDAHELPAEYARMIAGQPAS